MLKSEKLQLAIISLFAAVILFAKLGQGGLASLDDCYYAQQAKEIVKTGDWLTMHYEGRPMHENDPVCLWSMALMYKTFGISEFTARFHSAFFGLLTIMLVYFLGRLLYGQWTGIFSSVILLTTQIFTKYARHAMLDVTLTFFVLLALFFFAKAVKEPEDKPEKQVSYLIFFGLATGTAILTKNLLGLFPLLTAFSYVFFNKKFHAGFSLRLTIGSYIALLPPALWYYYSYKVSGPAFFKTHFGYIIFDRALKEEAGKQNLRSYATYFIELFRFYQPWVFLALAGFGLMVKKWVKEKDNGSILLVSHVLITLCLLSLANARKIWYIMPVFPAFAIMGSLFANEYLLKKEKTKKLTLYSFFALGFILSVIILFTPVRLDWNRNADIKALAPFVKATVPEGTRVLTYKTEEYFALQLPFIFYTDRSSAYAITKKEEMINILEGKEQVFVLTYLAEYKELGSRQLIARYGELVFFSNKSVKGKTLPLFEATEPYAIRR